MPWRVTLTPQTLVPEPSFASHEPPNGGAEPPCGWRSVTRLDLKYCKGKINLKKTLDSKVGSSDLLCGTDITFTDRSDPSLDFLCYLSEKKPKQHTQNCRQSN